MQARTLWEQLNRRWATTACQPALTSPYGSSIRGAGIWRSVKQCRRFGVRSLASSVQLNLRDNVDSFAESRTIRPIILAIASAIPGASGAIAGADSWVLTHVQQQKEERLRYLIECLESGMDDFGGPIPIQMSEPVLHAAYVTIEATLRTSRREKIRAFARLLRSGLETPPRLDLKNEHEDYLKILDELSVRELNVLWLLNDFEKRNPRQPEDSDYEWTKKHWHAFKNDVVARVNMPEEEISGLLMRLARTGTFEPIYVSGYGGDVSSAGMLTGAYKRLAELLGDDQGLFDSGKIVP